MTVKVSHHLSDVDDVDDYKDEMTIDGTKGEDLVFTPTVGRFQQPSSWVRRHWIRATETMRRGITRSMVAIAMQAATYPRLCIMAVIGVSAAFLTAGIMTNLYIDTNLLGVFTPTTSRTIVHRDWAHQESGLPGWVVTHVPFKIIVHAHGENVISYEGVEKVFEVWNLATSIEGLDHLCSEQDGLEIDLNVPYTGKCDFQAITGFWNHNQARFEEEVPVGDDVTRFLLNETYPDGVTVDMGRIFGNLEVQEDGVPLSAEALFAEIALPLNAGWTWDDIFAYTDQLKGNITALRQSWAESDETDFVVEFVMEYNVGTEFAQTIYSDFPLLPFVFSVMLVFTCCVFWKWHRVQSRLLLALGSVVTVVLSMATGFGIMFTIGVPYTVVTSILPYIIFGVGLDDTFIIYGAWERTDSRKSIPDRVREVMEEVGLTITMTTLTTSLAFGLGCISTIPAIRDLCFYAFPTVLIDGFYQVSFFISLVVLDERRIQANRRDCCPCVPVNNKNAIETCGSTDDSADSNDSVNASSGTSQRNQEGKQGRDEHDKTPHPSTRIMRWYANQLLRPRVKIAVLLSFAGMFCGFTYSATLLKQDFSFYDLLPSASSTRSYLSSLENYGGVNGDVSLYFRGLNQSDLDVQDQMIDFIDQIASIDHIELKPFCWVKDFRLLMDEPEIFIANMTQNPAVAQVLESNPQVIEFLESEIVSSTIDDMTFDQVYRLMMSQPLILKMYRPHVREGRDREILVSRCQVRIKNLDYNNVNDQITLLSAQNYVTDNSPLNQNAKEYSAFLYKDLFHLWEFFDVAMQELRYTAVVGITSVTAFAFFFVPHWSAVFYVFPFMVMLYIDLLGLFQALGMTINVLTYVTLVVAVGLLVDFLMHMLLRYYESTKTSRDERVKDTLTTMGASIMLGAVSTFLGSVPLMFSQSAVFRTMYLAFFAMIFLGLSHGLVLLPVLLSIFGTESKTCHLDEAQDVKVFVNNVQSYLSEPRKEEDDHTDGSSSSLSGGSIARPDSLPSSFEIKHKKTPTDNILLVTDFDDVEDEVRNISVDHVCQAAQTYDQYEIQIV